MTLRHKLGALLGAGLLTFAVAGAALATDLNVSFVGQTLGSLPGGTADECSVFTLGAGEVGIQFNLTSAASDTKYRWRIGGLLPINL